MIEPTVLRFDGGITAIDTHFQRPQMDASHLITHHGQAAFVDTGTNHSIVHLLAGLERLGLTPADVRYVLLTHIHLDHAGGAGLLMQSLPNAELVVHPRGARHMADPTRLWEGALAVYGEEEMNRTYGRLHPISADRIITVEDESTLDLAGRQLRFLHTEGHARHHVCIVDELTSSVFTGDTFGLSYRELDTHKGPFIFPTTTPVHFDPVAMHASVDRIMGQSPSAVFLTHFSRVDDLPRLASDLHEQIDEYVALAREVAHQSNRHDALKEGIAALLMQRLDLHGCTLSQNQRAALLNIDIELNAQGVGVWLDAQNKEPKTS